MRNESNKSRSAAPNAHVASDVPDASRPLALVRAAPSDGRSLGQRWTTHWQQWWPVWVAFVVSRASVFMVGLGAEYAARGRGIAHGSILRAGTYVHYQDVVVHGYTAQNATEYPLLPSVLAALHGIGLSLGAASLVLQTLAFGVALFAFVAVGTHFVGREAAARGALLLAIFPSAYWFSFASTESAMLMLTLCAVLAARRGRWGVAGVCAVLDALARPPAIFVIVVLAAIAYGSWRATQSAGASSGEASGDTSSYALTTGALWRPALAILAPIAAIAGFFLYLGHRTGDVLASVHAQAAYGRSMSLLGPIHAVQHVVRSARASTFGPTGELVVLCAAVGLLVWFAVNHRPMQSVRRWELWGWLAFAALSLGMPLSTGIVWQMPRFVLVVPPVFWALGAITRRPWLRESCVLVFAMALAVRLTFEVVGAAG